MKKEINLVSRENFSLTKVKVMTGKNSSGLEIVYREVSKSDSTQNEKRVHVENTEMPHPDLLKIFDELRPFVGTIMDYDYPRTVIIADAFKGTKAQAEIIEAAIAEITGKIRVYSASVSGLKASRGVILSFQKKTASNSVITANTPRIQFAANTLGFEPEVEALWLRLEDEVYKYAIERKYAQMELFEPDSDSNDGEGEE